jgi:type I restriction enzyme M protein
MAQTNATLIWKIADLLSGPYQPNQYGDVILPFTILRRLDCILEPTKDEVLVEYKKIQSTKVDPRVLLKAKFKLPFYNTSRWTFASLVGDPEGWPTTSSTTSSTSRRTYAMSSTASG